MKIIEINESRCKLSYACVRICPVKAIEVRADLEFPLVVQERCIGCGSCIQACSQSAITYYDSIPDVKDLLKSGHKVAAMLAPDIAAEFADVTDYRKFVNMTKQIGFSYINEVSFGVDLVAMKYAELLSNFKGKYYITANCPAIVHFVEKFHPALCDNLAPIVSPMIAMAKVVHARYGQDVKIVYIGPCIDSKIEAMHSEGDGKVDAVLTFHELRQIFQDLNILESTLEYSEFDAPLGYKGALYPISSAILEVANVPDDLLTGKMLTADGKDNVSAALNSFEHEIDDINHHMNLFYCEGCMMGPAMTTNASKYVRRARVVEYANKRSVDFDRKSWANHMLEYGKLDLSRKFHADDQRIPSPSEEKVQEILNVLGKPDHEDEIGCGTCGYKSCHDFAVAVAQGLAKTEMCLTFSLKNRQDYIKTLKQTNEKLAKTQEALRESERVARIEQQVSREALETTGAMLQKLPSGVVIVDDKLKIIQANKRFIDTLGKEAAEINEIIPGLKGADLKTLLPYQFYNIFTYVIQNDDDVSNRDISFEDRMLNVSVFTIRKNKVVGAVIRDMFLPEVQKEEVIRRVTEAIDENLEVVQKIAFLLGEGASRTEKILNSIIEFHKKED